MLAHRAAEKGQAPLCSAHKMLRCLRNGIGVRRFSRPPGAVARPLRKPPAQAGGSSGRSPGSRLLMVRCAAPNSRKPEPRAEGTRFLDQKNGFPQRALRSSRESVFSAGRREKPPCQNFCSCAAEGAATSLFWHTEARSHGGGLAHDFHLIPPCLCASV